MKMELVRLRDRSNDKETFGTLTVDSFNFVTVEQPWNDNKKAASCIPVGTYIVYPHVSPRFGECYILENTALGVGKYEGPGIKRSAILIHPANFAFQLQGCIAPGKSFGKLQFKGALHNAVLSSRDTFNALMGILTRKGNHTLEIRWDK